jgi:hypothetical protein
MKIKNLEFKEALEFLDGQPEIEQVKKKKRKKKKEPKAKAVPLDYKSACDHYTTDTLQSYADYLFKDHPKQFKKAWAYKNEKGQVELVAARFEDEKGDKTVLSFYWNGSTLKMKGYPVLLFNRDRIKSEPEKDILIVFGEKCAAIADELGFIGATWNGGEKKVKEVDFSPLENRTIFLWADDDRPGQETAKQIIAKLPHVQVVKTMVELREIEPKGADIAEALEYFKGDLGQVSEYIYQNSERIERSEDQPPSRAETLPAAVPAWPFTILGIADDGKAYFIGQNDRMFAFNPTSISKTQLINLKNVDWWREEYDGGSAKNWENAISDIVFASSTTDFDPDRMRGRGAWREPDGRICYHDGRKTHGAYSKDRIYLRRAVNDIGISHKEASSRIRKHIGDIVSGMTFETPADCYRTLGWSVLAPFAGALPWRPAGLMTAASGSGKTTIVNRVIKPLAMPIICSGGESTSAGIRQRIGVDSCAIVVEEAETDTMKKKQNRDETFSLMRQSTSDDSPDVLKGTIDGKGLRFTLRSMFFFVSISPEIESEADENRIFRVSLVKANYPRKEWLAKEKELMKTLTHETCQGVRAFTWNHLPEIMKLSERVAVQAQVSAGIDNRTAFSESLLIAAYLAVFESKLDISDEELALFVTALYKVHPLEQRRNENEEMLDQLLDYIIHYKANQYSIRELMFAIETGTIAEGVELASSVARRIAGIYGIGMTSDGNLAIAKNHPEIMKILNKGKGYQLQLARHPDLIDKSKNVSLGSGNVKNCVVIRR